MIDLSVIVPVYNVENYIEECLESIIAIKGIETQIICVDDCSTDDSYIVLSRYEKNNNIVIKKNSKNLGLAATRNEGMKYAEGQYVLFVDSDDYINSDCISSFVKKAKQESIDALYYDAEEFGNVGIISSDRRKRKNIYCTADGLTIFDQMVRNHEMFGSVWSALYKREFICEEKIQFIDGILHEDIPYTFEVLNKARIVSVVNEVGYFYRQREQSILHQPNYLNRASGLIVGYSRLLIIWNETIQTKQSACFVESCEAYLTTILSMIYSNLKKCRNTDYSDYPIVNHFVKNLKFNEYSKYINVLDNATLNEIRTCKSVAIYGAGNIATELMHFFESINIEIDKVFVTKEGDKRQLLNKDVVKFTPEEGKRTEKIIIAVSRLYEDEILAYLMESGYKGKIIKLSI